MVKATIFFSLVQQFLWKLKRKGQDLQLGCGGGRCGCVAGGGAVCSREASGVSISQKPLKKHFRMRKIFLVRQQPFWGETHSAGLYSDKTVVNQSIHILAQM